MVSKFRDQQLLMDQRIHEQIGDAVIAEMLAPAVSSGPGFIDVNPAAIRQSDQRIRRCLGAILGSCRAGD